MVVCEVIKFTQTAIGAIPSDWASSSIEAIASPKKGSLSMGPFGSNITKDNFKPAGVPVIRGNNLTEYCFHDSHFVFLSEEKADELRSSNAKPEDLVITHRGTLGQVGIIPTNSKYKRYVVSQSGMKLTCDKEKVNPRFVFYWLKSPKGQQELLRNTSQTGVPAIAQPLSSLRKVKLPLPSLTEQNAIVVLLSNFNDRLDVCKQMNCTLEAVGAALFKRWFVDFEFPNPEGKPYKATGGKMADSELGNIPDDWSVIGNISELCKEINYGYTQSSCTEEVGPKFLRVMDINKANWVDWSAVPFCKIDEQVKSKYLLDKKDIVIARMADPGKIAIYEANVPAVFASYLIRIRLGNPIFAYYIYYLLKSDYYQNFIEGAATGSVQKSLNAKALTNNLPIILPNEEIASMFDSIVGLLRKKINLNLEQSATLSKIRDYLLPKLMSGKIRVPLNNENLEVT
jgi:type I restriction enzyme, S subunit